MLAKVHIVKAMVFPVVMDGCESWTIKKCWMPKNWCFWTVVLEKTLESPFDSKEIKPVNPKINQPLIFIGRTVAETETLILWPPDEKNWLFRKDPDAGKDRRQEEKGMASLTQWTWVWASSGSWWWTRKPGVLQSMGSQRVRHGWATELNWFYPVWWDSCSGGTCQHEALWFQIIWRSVLWSHELFFSCDTCTAALWALR